MKNKKRNCLNCKKYYIEKDEEGYGYICEAEQKQEDSGDYPNKRYYQFWEYAINPEKENDCHKWNMKN